MYSNEKLLPYQNMGLEDLEDEIWKDIPGLEEYGMISNYGRVKRLSFEAYNSMGRLYRYEERIQKQKISAYFNVFKQEFRGNLSARIQIDNISHSISIGRMVYYSFVETFDLSDRSIYISYKDYDALNTTPNNLFKTDHAGLQQHIIKAGRKDLHFGHNEANQAVFTELGRQVNRKKIHQYNMQGNYVATYNSLTEASQETGVSLSHISSASKMVTPTAGGFIWRSGRKRVTIGVKNIHARIRASKGASVSQYDLDGNRITTYYNINQAARQIGVRRESLRNAVYGKILVMAGSVWRKGEADQIDTTLERRSVGLRSGYTLSQYSVNGERLITFHSSKEAARYASVQTEQINAMAIRDDLLLKGFIWRYGDAALLSEEEVNRIQHNVGQEKRRDVTQYDLLGIRVGYFPTMTDASYRVGVPLGSVIGCVNGHKATGGGFIWRRGNGAIKLNIPETPYPLGNKLVRGVSQYTLKGELICRYATIAEAAKMTGVHKTNISNATKGRSKSAGGYIWKTGTE
ncbi:NUMOD4 domain-containing protein [Sphingobacterium sp. SRCM116780]|uniref:NUMOD1 domain-containing DNA-binding protein n=1 Tax=Sphingobacterium sp. SRCM116780 TaxID=2907623 RepID=UPI001F2EDF9D|nr:NUMOD1 domain-containing DNA-binding protein [Sphingobacterium sp. SRCM116780]UIR56445.1 NUMOD4 domain-containing protein [Sphingobacterium sp. SRCM116780]